jgi:hypothetical protein
MRRDDLPVFWPSLAGCCCRGSQDEDLGAFPESFTVLATGRNASPGPENDGDQAVATDRQASTTTPRGHKAIFIRSCLECPPRAFLDFRCGDLHADLRKNRREQPAAYCFHTPIRPPVAYYELFKISASKLFSDLCVLLLFHQPH